MPRSAESLCSRTRSKEGIVVGEKTLTRLPVVAEVRLMPMMGRLKLKKLAPAGGVSRIVTVKLALPLVHPVVHVLPLGKPLQEEIRKTAAKNDNERRIRFIEHPTEVRTGLPRRTPALAGNLRILPHKNSKPCRNSGIAKERIGAQVLTVRCDWGERRRV